MQIELHQPVETLSGLLFLMGKGLIRDIDYGLVLGCGDGLHDCRPLERRFFLFLGDERGRLGQLGRCELLDLGYLLSLLYYLTDDLRRFVVLKPSLSNAFGYPLSQSLLVHARLCWLLAITLINRQAHPSVEVLGRDLHSLWHLLLSEKSLFLGLNTIGFR